MKSFSFLALIAAVSLVAVPATAAESVGRVIALDGNPKVERASGGVIQLQKEDPVHLGDVVRTGNGKVKIMFEDGSLMTLAENTGLKITEFLYEPQKQERSSMFDLLGGKIKTLVGSLFSSEPDFKVRTPTAVAGVRGTHFRVDFDGDTDVVVFSGQVDVQDGAGNTFSLSAGGFVNAGNSGFSGDPVQLSPEELSQKENEVEIRLQDMLNDQATSKVDNRSQARRAVEITERVPGQGAGGTPGSENRSPRAGDAGIDPPNPLADQQSVDPKINGNVTIPLSIPEVR